VSAQEQRLADLAWREYQAGVSRMGQYCIKHAPFHLATCKRRNELQKLLIDPAWMQSKLQASDVVTLLGDYDLALNVIAADVGGAAAKRKDRVRSLLRQVQHSLRVSAQVLAQDNGQLAAQLLGRIAEKQFRKTILQWSTAIPQPWLRPITASLAAEQSTRWLKPWGETLSQVAFTRDGRWAAHFSGTFGGEQRNVMLWDLTEWRSLGSHFRTLARLNPSALALSNNARWCLYADSIGGVHRLGEAGEIWDGHAHDKRAIARCLGISDDGQRALSACQYGRLVAWDIKANRHQIVWDESDNYTDAMQLDAIGSRAVVARCDGSIALVELWPTRVRTIYKTTDEPTAVAVSLDNSVFAVATASGRVEVRHVQTAATIVDFSVGEKPTALALSAGARYMTVGTEKGTIEIWGLAPPKQTARYRRAHTYEISQIAFCHDNAHVVSADSLHIKEWSIHGDERESAITAPIATGEVKVTTDGRHAVAVLESGQLGVWNLHSGELKSTLPGPSGLSFGDQQIGPAERIALASQAREVLAWNRKLLCVWNLTTGKCVGARRASEDSEQPRAVEIRDAAISRDGAAVVYLDGMDVSFWSPGEGNPRVLGTYEGDPPRYVAISPDRRFALSSGAGRQIHLWRLSGRPNPYREKIRAIKRETEQLQRELGLRPNNFDPEASYRPDYRHKPSSVVFAGQNDAVVTTGDGSLFAVVIHDDPSGPRLEGSRLAGRHNVSRIVMDPQRRIFVTSSHDGSTRVWSFDKHCTSAVLNAHPGTVQQLSASADRILMNTRDGIVNIVELGDGSLVAAFQGDRQIASSDCDAELRHVVALDQGGQMHFLHLESD